MRLSTLGVLISIVGTPLIKEGSGWDLPKIESLWGEGVQYFLLESGDKPEKEG